MEPLRSGPTLIEQVHRRLVDAIADGSLPPGARLTQEDLADRLSVSRQPVSHALQLLRRQNLVIEEGRRGLAVAPIDRTRVRDLYLLRGAIDGLAARLAAERIRDGAAPHREIAALKSALAAGGTVMAGASVHDQIEADVAFHEAVYRLSGNPAIAETVAEQWPHFRRCIGIVFARLDRLARVWREHATITERILAGDARRARQASVDHTEKAGETLYARLGDADAN